MVWRFTQCQQSDIWNFLQRRARVSPRHSLVLWLLLFTFFIHGFRYFFRAAWVALSRWLFHSWGFWMLRAWYWFYAARLSPFYALGCLWLMGFGLGRSAGYRFNAYHFFKRSHRRRSFWKIPRPHIKLLWGLPLDRQVCLGCNFHSAFFLQVMNYSSVNPPYTFTFPWHIFLRFPLQTRLLLLNSNRNCLHTWFDQNRRRPQLQGNSLI